MGSASENSRSILTNSDSHSTDQRERWHMSSPKIRLAPEQKEKLLRNIWLLHDGRWFLKSVEQFGFDAATKLNLAVVKSIARTEMRQLLTETGLGEGRNTKDLQALMGVDGEVMNEKDTNNCNGTCDIIFKIKW